MRSFIFYLCGLILLPVSAVCAADLPANPWLRAAVEEIPLQANNQNTYATDSAARTARMTELINKQLDNPQSQLMQVINEALPEQQRQSSPSAQKNLPSWQELMSQINVGSLAPKASGSSAQTARTTQLTKNPIQGYNEINRAMSDIERQYNKAKHTTNTYYNQAKRNIKHLETEAENSVNRLKKVWAH